MNKILTKLLTPDKNYRRGTHNWKCLIMFAIILLLFFVALEGYREWGIPTMPTSTFGEGVTW